MKYEVYITAKVEKDLENLGSNKNKSLAIQKLKLLIDNPYLGQSLSGVLSEYYSLHFSFPGSQARAIYTVTDNKLIVLVIAVGHREEIYKLAVKRSKASK
ncbi:MAG: type II toxin-antitoxin system RelE/ParE family toxin [Desulfotomaculum sp.]|nr:type II toxin-antitoxin system RelE/ParE family toxin [Desulfotomaculum sp.]MCL0080839.1 type II toxin-antitoxin system RelE/ParE family toxin [Peptococcaceae bacterium]